MLGFFYLCFCLLFVTASYGFSIKDIISSNSSDAKTEEKKTEKNFSLVKIKIVQKKDGTSEVVEIKKSKTQTAFDERVVIEVEKIEYFRQDSSSCTAFVKVYNKQNDKEYSSWIVKNYPGISEIEHPLYDFILIDCF